MRRREFIADLGGAAAWPLVARGQRPMKTIGYVSPAAGQNDIDAAFDEALQQRGWVPGKNIIIEKRWTNGRQDTIAPIVAEINALNVDAVVAWSPPIALAMKRSTQVPLVFLITFDPVEVGLVSNLAAPEGNLTGITSLASLENNRQAPTALERSRSVRAIGGRSAFDSKYVAVAATTR